MRSNKPAIPPEFLATKDRDPGSALVGYNGQKSLTSCYAKKGKKPVVMLSTKEFDEPNGVDEKPAVIQYYNKTKGAVDVGDQMTRNMTVSRRSRVWTKKIFMELIDIACLNAFIVFTHVYADWRKTSNERRSLFLQSLAEELTVPYMRDRLETGHLCAELTKDITDFIDGCHLTQICPFCNSIADAICRFCKLKLCKVHCTEKEFVICHSCAQSEEKELKHQASLKKSRRCKKCSKRRISWGNRLCCGCGEIVCRNCSVEKMFDICNTCKKK